MAREVNQLIVERARKSALRSSCVKKSAGIVCISKSIQVDPLGPIHLNQRNWQRDAQAALGISANELQQATERSRSEDIRLLGLRFSNDWICPAQRFATLDQQFGDRFIRIEIPSEPDNPYGIPPKAHSVLTEDYKTLEKYKRIFPDKDPRRQVIEFLNRQLKTS